MREKWSQIAPLLNESQQLPEQQQSKKRKATVEVASPAEGGKNKALVRDASLLLQAVTSTLLHLAAPSRQGDSSLSHDQVEAVMHLMQLLIQLLSQPLTRKYVLALVEDRHVLPLHNREQSPAAFPRTS